MKLWKGRAFHLLNKFYKKLHHVIPEGFYRSWLHCTHNMASLRNGMLRNFSRIYHYRLVLFSGERNAVAQVIFFYLLIVLHNSTVSIVKLQFCYYFIFVSNSKSTENENTGSSKPYLQRFNNFSLTFFKCLEVFIFSPDKSLKSRR